MSETPSQSTITTPAHRRQGRGNGRPAARKAYNSENDAANIDPSRCDRIPRTPRKRLGSDSPAASSGHTNSKQRSRNGDGSSKAQSNRPKNTPGSPGSSRAGHQTPPSQSSAIKPFTVPAFAGATFHASPAPSALPLPSFVSRPCSESPNLDKTCQDIQEPLPSTEREASIPSHQPTPPTKESPLDFMFRAHRQEKERQQSASSTSFQPSGLTSNSPSTRSTTKPKSITKPATLPQAVRHQGRRFISLGGIDIAELNGTSGCLMGPAFSTPYQERIKAARSDQATKSSSSQLVMDHASEDPAEALKKFLLQEPISSMHSSISDGYSSAPPSRPFAHPRSGSGATGPCKESLKDMEDDLRRILKLDLATGPSATDRRLLS